MDLFEEILNILIFDIKVWIESKEGAAVVLFRDAIYINERLHLCAQEALGSVEADWFFFMEWKFLKYD